MKTIDPNKPTRDAQRRFLQKHGWVAVTAVKTNGAYKPAWIHPKRKGSYSRQNAVNITKRNSNGDFYTLNNKFFSKKNAQSSYWAGFLAADGSITKTTVSIDLQNQDINHLKKLKNTLDYKGEIQTYKKCVRIQFNNIQIVKDLEQKFNIHSKKSLKLHAPNLCQEHSIRAFIRGYMDGDGSIYMSEGYPAVSFNGTNQMLGWIKRRIQDYVDTAGNPSIIKHASIFKLTFKGNQAYDILDWIYQDANKNTRLDRKYKKYRELA